jgi:hypothetical protein
LPGGNGNNRLLASNWKERCITGSANLTQMPGDPIIIVMSALWILGLLY